MNTKILALGGAFLLFAAGAQARSSSAAAERAETSALNLEQAQRNEAALPQAPVPTDFAANLPANAPPAAAPTMMADAALLPAPAGTAPVQPPPPETNTGVVKTLDKMDGLPNQVASAKVIDENGKQIGTVQMIEFGAANAPLKLDVVLLGSSKVITMDAARVSYNPANNTVIARSADGALTQAQH